MSQNTDEIYGSSSPPDVQRLKYGDFLFAGKKTSSVKRVYSPNIEAFPSIIESEDHSIPLGELIARLDTDLTNGLKEDQIDSVRERYGANEVDYPKKLDFFHVRGSHFFLCIGIVYCCIPDITVSPASFNLDNLYLSAIMVLMIIISIAVSYWQEGKSFNIMNSFRDLYPQYSSVIRDGKKVRIHLREIVVGDLVLLKAGCKVPADIRVTESMNLSIDEFPVKGDPAAAVKTSECTSQNPAVSKNVAFYGTWCMAGSGKGIAIATGNRTAFAQMVMETFAFQEMETKTYVVMRRILKVLGAITLIFGIVLLVMNVLMEYSWIILIGVILSQIIASMPDILYSIVTGCFCSSALNMVSKNCLPKNYEAVEKLGSTNVICCDKTGTITQNRMTVVHLWIDDKIISIDASDDQKEMKLRSTPDSDTWIAFLRTASLCSTITSKSRRNWCIIKKGCSCDQSEVAIMEFIRNTPESKEKMNDIRKRYKKVFEIPYNSYRKFHVTIHEAFNSPNDDCEFVICIKGAMEEVLKYCSTVLTNGKDEPISTLYDLDFQRSFEEVMRDGERVIGFCDYRIPEKQYRHGHIFEENDIPMNGFRFLGFVSLLDPLRASVPEAVKRCRQADIKVIMMTGDHPITAMAIARQAGIISSGSYTKEEIMKKLKIPAVEVPPGSAKAAVISGVELESMTQEDLSKLMKSHEDFVFARITPEQKIKMVEILKLDGKVVALTGDSYEDSLAMRKADIGIGMGLHGCDISREIADIILLGDNFDSLVSGVEQGRIIYDNLRKAMMYVLSSNAPELFSFFVAYFLCIPIPLGAVFILLISLIAETFPVLCFTKDKPDGDIMTRQKFGPYNFFERRIVQKSYFQVGVLGIFSGLFVYLMIMAQNGFLPTRILGIAKVWNSPSVNDLKDSFNQEWTYSARKSLEYTCQTAFFLSIIVLQWFNFVICRIHNDRHTDALYTINIHSLTTSVCIPVCQAVVILILMYTPGISTALHFYPLKITDWLMCLPFPVVFVVLNELRRYMLRYSSEDSWFAKETF